VASAEAAAAPDKNAGKKGKAAPKAPEAK